MQVMIDIPDEIAQSLLSQGRNPSRELLELAVLSGLRDGRIYESQAVALLGMASRFELWEWLKAVEPREGTDTISSVEADLDTLASHRKPLAS